MTKKTQKKLRKALLLISCAALLVCITVGVTVAYLTSSDSVKNTFTVGQVKITLDEAKVGEDGKALEGEDAERVAANSYKLLPGFTYDKDPTIHIDPISEEAYLRVKVSVSNTAKVDALFQEKGYAEAGITAILKGFNANLWNVTSNTVENDVRTYVFEYKQKIVGGDDDIVLFTNVVVPDDFDNDDVIELNNTDMTIVAEAIQADGFNTAALAWAEWE